MPAPNLRQQIQELPLAMVGGTQFGRYPKISDEQTFNFIISDNALVPYAGYKSVTSSPNSPGRGIYSSSRGNIMIAVWGAQVYSININLQATLILGLGLATSSGDVYISENNNAEIAITDGARLYVYNWSTPLLPLQRSDVDFMVGTFPISSPGFVSFQNGRLIIANLGSQNWYLSGENDATMWDINPATANHGYVGALQSKPDSIQAAVPTPGGGNNILIFGRNVVEQWQDIGAAKFPYQRASTFNVDYGTLNASSISALDNYVVWLAGNEQSGATLMVFDGRSAKSISTDGMDFKFASLSNPSNCSGFLFRQDGHVIYQFTFVTDNLSYAYDINTGKFFTVTDEKLDYHIACDVVFFGNQYYFVSFKGGDLFQFGTQYTNAQYADDDIQPLPRIRITPPSRLVSQLPFIIKSLGFTIENGAPNGVTQDNTLESVDLSVSRDGGESFGNSLRLDMNATGKRRSRFIYQRLGRANDATFQIRFNGYGRFVVLDGQIEVYQ